MSKDMIFLYWDEPIYKKEKDNKDEKPKNSTGGKKSSNTGTRTTKVLPKQ